MARDECWTPCETDLEMTVRGKVDAINKDGVPTRINLRKRLRREIDSAV